MVLSDTTGMQQYFNSENQPFFPNNFGLMHNNNNSNLPPSFQFNRFQTNSPNYQYYSTTCLPIPLNESSTTITPQSPYFSNNSTSDEADDQQLGLINERKQRRMISNRESARRSRMRKQRQLEELWSQVLQLRTENHSLRDKLNDVSESHDKAIQENSRLKQETSDLHQMLGDLRIGSPFNALDEITCNSSD